jgi:hypothetical protein
MLPSVLLVWIGALLIIGGVLFTAAQAIRRGRLSVPRQSRPGLAVDTLEPPPGERSGGFGLKANWPGLALIALGCLLLLAGAVI